MATFDPIGANAAPNFRWPMQTTCYGRRCSSVARANLVSEICGEQTTALSTLRGPTEVEQNNMLMWCATTPFL